MTAARFRAVGLVGVGILTVAACGKEIGRIPLRDQGGGEATVHAAAGKTIAPANLAIRDISLVVEE